jgi:hypothetical protein
VLAQRVEVGDEPRQADSRVIVDLGDKRRGGVVGGVHKPRERLFGHGAAAV